MFQGGLSSHGQGAIGRFCQQHFPHIFTLNRWKSLLKKRKDDTEAAVKVAQEGSGS